MKNAYLNAVYHSMVKKQIWVAGIIHITKTTKMVDS